MVKVGIEYKKRIGRALPFASVVDAITFGIVDGVAFDTGRKDWDTDEKVRWAEGNAKFFEGLARNLKLWSLLVAIDPPTKSIPQTSIKGRSPQKRKKR